MGFKNLTQSLTRRTFIKTATGTGAALSAAGKAISEASPTLIERRPDLLGKKGKTYPDQRRKYTDSKSGRTVWQLTDTPGFTTQTLYWTNQHSRDSRWMPYASGIYQGEAGGRQRWRYNLFNMDLRTGESVQLTDSGNVVAHSPDLSRDGKTLYYFEAPRTFRSVNLGTLEDREICKLEDKALVTHALSVNASNRWAVVAAELNEPQGGYRYARYSQHMVLALIDVTDGSLVYLINGNTSLGHVAFSPTNPNLVLYSYHGQWWEIQRPWLIEADGTGSRPIFLAHNGEAVGHEFWSDNGKNIYVSCFGGRQPQGLWRTDLSGNEKCVLAGSSVAHNAVNAEEDRFVVDELYHDTTALWTSRKGSTEPEILCQLAADWWVGPERAGRDHPHSRFLPNSQGLTFSSAGEIYLVEI